MSRLLATPYIALAALTFLALQASATEPMTLHTKWDPQIFALAAQQHRFVLLDLNAVWCHWCHVMDETTYRDPQVKQLLDQHYLVVSVDADSDPELASRYGNWGWPATIVLAADGSEIVKRRGYILPEQFAAMLRAIVSDPSPGPSVDILPVINKASSARLGRPTRIALQKAVDGLYDDANGGWGEEHKLIDASSLQLSYLAVDTGDDLAGRRARQTLDANLNLIDSVWGGVYQYSDTRDWRSPHFEKLTSYQADDLRLYSEAYARWADPRYLQAALSLYTYLTGYLAAPDGGFYASQDADLSSSVTGREFYAKDAAGRRQLGAPRVDTHEYTRESAWAIRALCKYFDITGNRQSLKRAESAAHWVISQRARAEGGYRHDVVDRGGPFLDDSVAITHAFLALYQSTADPSWLAQAESSLDFIERALRDANVGYDSTPKAARARGVFGIAFRSPEQNADLVLCANLGFHFTGREKYRSMSRHAMRYLVAIANAEPERFHPEVLLADREYSIAPIHITVIGAKSDPRAQGLHAAALRYPSDYLQVEWWDPAEGAMRNSRVQYPTLDKAAAFACSATACSSPIFDPQELRATVQRASIN